MYELDLEFFAQVPFRNLKLQLNLNSIFLKEIQLKLKYRSTKKLNFERNLETVLKKLELDKNKLTKR
jgi:hypothetical protein